MSNITQDFIYQLPSNDTVGIQNVLFELPMQFTDGLYLNIWMFGLYGILFISGLQFRQGTRKAALFASFGGFITSFLLVLAGIAGANQLIPATVILIGVIFANYTESGGAGL